MQENKDDGPHGSSPFLFEVNISICLLFKVPGNLGNLVDLNR